MVGHGFHALAFPAEQISDKVIGGQGTDLAWLSFFRLSSISQSLASLAQSGDHSNIS